MRIFPNTKFRSKETEIMDDFSMKGELLRDTLDKLGSINKWLGGNAITISGVANFLKNKTKDKIYTIVDLGCGHGDILRVLADYGRKKGYKFKLIGIDANQDTIDYADELSMGYPEISFKTLDIFSEEFKTTTYDLALMTLFLHHFDDKQILKIIKTLSHSARLGVVVNDLQRSKIAYSLFKLLGFFITNHMIKQDGLTSILRAFKRQELEHVSQKLNLKYKIYWRWAFRYQWLIKT
ncbi:methyltransferase domain-containing protein [uncultured Algibacter sp.]|uniref:methyltransferase domain-containing protein n=1 Tax=uncultured Algibacter sp. TaxID=298659 RepID=UPI00321792EB